MALTIRAFQPITTTRAFAVGSAATTFTFGVNTTGLPIQTVRLYHAATAGAGPCFFQFIASTNTTTVGITNSVPLIAGPNTVGIFDPGGQACVAAIYASTFTGTIFVTGDIGYGST